MNGFHFHTLDTPLSLLVDVHDMIFLHSLFIWFWAAPTLHEHVEAFRNRVGARLAPALEDLGSLLARELKRRDL